MSDAPNNEHNCQTATEEIQKEWSEFKNRALYILLAGLLVFASYGMWVGTIQSRITHNEVSIAENGAEIVVLTNNQHKIDIAIAEILTELVGIKALLHEIINSFK